MHTWRKDLQTPILQQYDINNNSYYTAIGWFFWINTEQQFILVYSICNLYYILYFIYTCTECCVFTQLLLRSAGFKRKEGSSFQ